VGSGKVVLGWWLVDRKDTLAAPCSICFPRSQGCQSQEVTLKKDRKKAVFRNTCA
jgi:hypothetical protein